ncbi:MAG: LapA family protein [Sphingobacteriales bacterium]|nr:MAG: LapA family protein [Sphingobacteriales bacterium]
MSGKTIFIIAFTALITIFLMMNTDAVEFNLIFVKKDISKLVVVGVCTLVGFILGYWAGKPKTTISSYDKENPQDDPEERRNALSEEDRDYIN